MRVIPEDVLLDLLSRCLTLGQELLPCLAERGTDPVPESVARRYTDLLGLLHKQKRHDSVLCDESWEWIWEDRPFNHLQLYGRLAWLNYNLFDLL
jgi:hypothetical protein